MRDLAHYRAEAAVTKAFFKAGKERLLIACLDIDHTVRSEPRLRESRGEEVGSRDAPEHLSLGASRDAGGKKSSGGAIDRAVAAACHLMKSASGKTTIRKA